VSEIVSEAGLLPRPSAGPAGQVNPGPHCSFLLRPLTRPQSTDQTKTDGERDDHEEKPEEQLFHFLFSTLYICITEDFDLSMSGGGISPVVDLASVCQSFF